MLGSRINLLAKTLIFSAIFWAMQVSAANAATAANVSDEHIRQIVEGLLKEKDQKIEQLEARIQQLEHSPQSVTSSPPPLQANTSAASTVKASEKAPVATGKVTENVAEPAITSKLGAITEEIEELREAAKEKGLDISGFFDVNAKTDNSTDQTFSVGSVELDLEYAYNDHFAASSALVLCGNSSGTDYSAPAAITCGGSGPGGIGAGGAGIAVALVDYHMFDDSIPPRGRIFNANGLHVQGGRFDLPFSSDYQYFANTDRVTVTAPITTSRMQFGGYNGDGVRSYGSWNMFNYSVFWTDAMYAEDGTSVGGRLGMSVGQNTYRTHKNTSEGIEFGVSHLSDLDKNRNVRNSVYGADLSLGYSFLKLQNEVMWRNAHDNFIADDIDYGKPNELGYHTTLLADLENFIGYPVTTFARYGRWQPHNRIAEDYDGQLVAINNVSALTFGLNYKFNEYFKLKFEYTDSLGTQTQERYFDKNLGIAQLVVAF